LWSEPARRLRSDLHPQPEPTETTCPPNPMTTNGPEKGAGGVPRPGAVRSPVRVIDRQGVVPVHRGRVPPRAVALNRVAALVDRDARAAAPAGQDRRGPDPRGAAPPGPASHVGTRRVVDGRVAIGTAVGGRVAGVRAASVVAGRVAIGTAVRFRSPR
jgi:hypothetical protein